MASRIILLNTEQNKSKYLRDEMFFRHYWLQIKQNVYSIGTFRAPVATKKIAKSLILTVFHFSICQQFPECKDVSHASSDYISRKRSWQQIVNLSNYDRK